MTREELKNLIPDISDEVLGKVLDINGKDITKAKGKADDYKSQYEKAKSDLDTANATIKDLESKKDDTKALQDEIDKYKKADEDRKKAEKEAADNKALSERFDVVVGAKKFINDFTRNGIMNEFKSALADETNKGKGDKDIYDALVKDKDGIFANPNTVGAISGMGDIGGAASDDKIRAVMGLAPIDKK